VRRAGSRVFNFAAASLVGSMRDTQCGFKMFDGELAREVFSTLQLNGFAFDVELIARLMRSGIDLVELPVKWSDDGGSTFNLVSDGARAFRDLYLVRRALADSHGRS
jgi:dolichyl-phosphate beta-glucosyltransferase